MAVSGSNKTTKPTNLKYFPAGPSREKFASPSRTLLSMLFLQVTNLRQPSSTLQSPISSQSDLLGSWANTNLGSFVTNLVRNECFDFWHTINQWRQAISLNASLEGLHLWGCCLQGVMQPHDSDRSAGKAEAGINNYHEKVSAQGKLAASFQMLMTLFFK